MNPEAERTTRTLREIFPERPTEVANPEQQAERRERVLRQLKSQLSEWAPAELPRMTRSTRGGHPAIIALTASLALAAAVAAATRALWTEPTSVPPVATLRTIERVGATQCRLGKNVEFGPCSAAQGENPSGLRTLASARWSVETLNGVHLALAPDTTLLFDEGRGPVPSSRVTLTLGHLDVQVPKLGRERSFAVATPNATITVHGTAFSVEVASLAATKTSTCVRLREGVISVESAGTTTLLSAPAQWGCAAEAIAEARPLTAAEVTRSQLARPIEPANPGNGKKRKSTLGQETRLLQQAILAEQSKDFESARRLYQALLTQYPNSVMALDAKSALERLAHSPGQARPRP